MVDDYVFTNVVIDKRRAAKSCGTLASEFSAAEIPTTFGEALDILGIPFMETKEDYILGASWTSLDASRAAMHERVVLDANPTLPFMKTSRGLNLVTAKSGAAAMVFTWRPQASGMWLVSWHS